MVRFLMSVRSDLEAGLEVYIAIKVDWVTASFSCVHYNVRDCHSLAHLFARNRKPGVSIKKQDRNE